MKRILYTIFFLPCLVFGQVVFDSIPTDRQLVPRDLATNLGEVYISGHVDGTGVSYNFIQIDVFKDGVFHFSVVEDLTYSSNLAYFEFRIDINAELVNYDFQIFGDNGNKLVLEKSIDSIVAGDVYIIQGQSNAEARMRDGDSSSGVNSEFVRVYANGTNTSTNLIDNDVWYLGQGDGKRTSDGNTGQWGIKFASLINENFEVPVAIFNAGHGPKAISFFQRPPDYLTSLASNYARLHYRLRKTGLANHVRALFWSQGEQDGVLGTTTEEYINSFNSLYYAWTEDYPNLEEIIIFQTGNGCNLDPETILPVKEAQRLIAKSNSDVFILPTAAGFKSSDNCHFKFNNGYELFGQRIFDLISSTVYDLETYEEIHPPDIIDAYLVDDQTLVVETDSQFLFMDDSPVSDFTIESPSSIGIQTIELRDNQIVFRLSEPLVEEATISYLGPTGSTPTQLVKNSNELELLCFSNFPIDRSRYTVWDGVQWSNGYPEITKYVVFASDFNENIGNIYAKSLSIRSGSTVNFDFGTNNSIVINKDLIINGNLIVGDKESIVMMDNNALIEGELTKIEQSTFRANPHDFTYWSSPVEAESIESVFSDVTSNRIFYFDQSQSSASDSSDPSYWNIWQIATGEMKAGQGFASEGPTGTIGHHIVRFRGKPNNGIITRPLLGFFSDDEPSNDKNNNFNLLGNPYPSAININAFFDENKEVIDETIYFWTHATKISNETSGDFVSSDYATFNRSGGTASSNGGNKPRDTIGSAQGFFVRAIAPGSVKFDNSMRRANQNTLFFKDSRKKPIKRIYTPKNRLWLDLISDKGGFSQILLSFSEKATYDIDKGYDALKFNSNNPISFYSVVEGSKLVIQGLPEFTEEMLVPLGYDATAGPRKLSIHLNRYEGTIGDHPVYLVDNLLQKVHNLKESCYHFDQFSACEMLDRFEIRFTPFEFQELETNTASDYFNINSRSHELFIESSKDIGHLEIYDILGQRIAKKSPGSSSIEMKIDEMKTGSIYFIRAVLDDSEVISRKFFCF